MSFGCLTETRRVDFRWLGFGENDCLLVELQTLHGNVSENFVVGVLTYPTYLRDPELREMESCTWIYHSLTVRGSPIPRLTALSRDSTPSRRDFQKQSLFGIQTQTFWVRIIHPSALLSLSPRTQVVATISIPSLKIKNNPIRVVRKPCLAPFRFSLPNPFQFSEP